MQFFFGGMIPRNVVDGGIINFLEFPSKKHHLEDLMFVRNLGNWHGGNFGL